MQGEMDIRKGESTAYHYHPHKPALFISNTPPPGGGCGSGCPGLSVPRCRIFTSSNNQTAGELVLAVTYILKRDGLEEDDLGLYERTGDPMCWQRDARR